MHNVLVRGISERQHRALSVIAASFGMPSSNAVILAAVEALIQACAENDPLVASALKLQERQLPTRTKAPERVSA